MRKVWPHEFFRIDFDQMLEEGKHQERVNTANKGEYAIIQNMHTYINTEVLPLILNDDWVFEAAEKFATDYAISCFQYLKLGGREAYETQKRLLEINERVVNFLARARLDGSAPLAGEINLIKASDFFGLLDINGMTEVKLAEAVQLRQQAEEHEALQVFVTLRGIRDCYETPLPRIMHVIRRAIKVQLGLPKKDSDDELSGISQLMDWYETRIPSGHALYPVFGRLRDFYSVARNVGSHHEGLKWNPGNNQVVLPDKKITLTVPLYEFQQKYRHLVYLCELGLRGMLSAFCERERGARSKKLVQKYVETFPEDFPSGEEGTVKFYPLQASGAAQPRDLRPTISQTHPTTNGSKNRMNEETEHD